MVVFLIFKDKSILECHMVSECSITCMDLHGVDLLLNIAVNVTDHYWALLFFCPQTSHIVLQRSRDYVRALLSHHAL